MILSQEQTTGERISLLQYYPIDQKLLESNIEKAKEGTIRRTITFDGDNNCFMMLYRAQTIFANKEQHYGDIVNQLLRFAIKHYLNDSSPKESSE